ncbi:hypothetical protein [Rhizobium ecuadorense]|uniref:hypothetical protein n=1 Tax=Rhizobium ecuadorense TaxID=1671795 RepID=UPI00067394C3|nr:hypothetical protein [Rhizobium ecuadorense]
MESMVEKVARAIEGQDVLDDDDKYRSMAIAAIAALRTPTEAMIKAEAEFDYYEGNRGRTKSEAEEVWSAMIDAALKEAGEKLDANDTKPSPERPYSKIDDDGSVYYVSAEFKGTHL